jgi:hypothetical protein
LGSFLRAFRFGHVRQLDAVASRFLIGLAGLTRLLGHPDQPVNAGGGYAVLDVDDTIIEVHGHHKQGAGFGYSRIRGLNALLATLAVAGHAPVKTARRLLGPDRPILVRMDSAFFGRPAVLAAITGGAYVSVTVRLTSTIRAAIAGIDDAAWTTINYPEAVRDEATGGWISRAEVAEIPFTAFTSATNADRVLGRLVVRRIPDLNAENKKADGQGTLFNVWRFHAFFTTADPAKLDTVAADKTHRGHAIIEQVHADLKNSALAHLPSGAFTANAAWLVLAVIAFNLTRAAATLATTAAPDIAVATTATIRRKLITVPARVATSARHITIHLPQGWPWQTAWTHIIDRVADPPPPATP